MKPFEYSHVFVIESLRAYDMKTGTDLYNDIIRPRMMQKGLENQCELINVESKNDFFQALEKIKRHEIFQLANPIIHLEMHGDENGLEVTNGETISWTEIQFFLLQINGICENNLFVSVATCKGGYIHKAINPAAWAPFWGFSGPFETVTGDEIIIDYSAFYNEFLQSGDFNLAIDALNAANPAGQSPFSFQNTEYIFQKAYENYELFHMTFERIEQRVETIFTECRPKIEFKYWSDQQIRDYAKHLIVNEGDNIKKSLMRKFFMIDKFPKHEQFYDNLH